MLEPTRKHEDMEQHFPPNENVSIQKKHLETFFGNCVSAQCKMMSLLMLSVQQKTQLPSTCLVLQVFFQVCEWQVHTKKWWITPKKRPCKMCIVGYLGVSNTACSVADPREHPGGLPNTLVRTSPKQYKKVGVFMVVVVAVVATAAQK